MTTYALRTRWIVPAILAGAGLGGAVVAVWTNAPLLLHGEPRAGNWVGATFVVAFIIWLTGLVTVGGILWRVNETTGQRSPARAVLVGMIATFLATILLTLLLSGGLVTSVVDGKALVLEGQRTAYGWWMLVRDAWLMSLLGGAVGGLVWRIAYRRSAES